MTFHEQITNDALALYDKGNLLREKLEFIQRELLATDTKYDSLLTRYQEQEDQLAIATKLLRFWVNDFYDSFNRSIKYEERHKAITEAEQFIKEIEE